MNTEKIRGLGLTTNDIIESYLYIMARYLVIRQEHTDMSEEDIDYNVIKYNPLGKAEFVNPNLDVAYLETWFAVDKNTPVILEIPEIKERYYTAQLCDEWAEIITNINERNYPDHPFGRYAICLKGSNPDIPEGVLRVDIPSKKAKMLARIERKGDDEGAIKLQKSFKIIKTGEPKIDKAVKIKMFTNKEPITVDAFRKPVVEEVIDSAPDSMTVAKDYQKKVRIIADFIDKSDENRQLIDKIIKEEVAPRVNEFKIKDGDPSGGWFNTAGHIKFDNDIWFRFIANFEGIWWNSALEAVYFIGYTDSDNKPLNGDNRYLIHYKNGDNPQKHTNAYWSLTLLSLPDFRVIPNEISRFNLNNISGLKLEEDGSLKIHISSELTPDIPESNWLPSPRGKGFTLNHRFYVPKEEILNREWHVPPITRKEK